MFMFSDMYIAWLYFQINGGMVVADDGYVWWLMIYSVCFLCYIFCVWLVGGDFKP